MNYRDALKQPPLEPGQTVCLQSIRFEAVAQDWGGKLPKCRQCVAYQDLRYRGLCEVCGNFTVFKIKESLLMESTGNKTFAEQVRELTEALGGAELDASKADSGNKAAARRVRGVLSDIKHACLRIRKEIQDRVKAG